MGRILDSDMIISDIDVDEYGYFPDIEVEFFDNASVEDGVSGKKPIDTSYENTDENDSWIQRPRSGE